MEVDNNAYAVKYVLSMLTKLEWAKKYESCGLG